MSEKQQFDEYLGGKEKLPRDAHIIKLASARASEMAAMTYSLENPKQTKLIFQKLPVHMRRRVMSHNAKRMPRKLRNGHISQMTKSGLPPKTKRPSRKYRRRPKNLLSEYNRRQRNKFWLETHIWHAKRFKMIEKWGFKLADHSNDRCFRANYRAIINHCLIQDISYYTCIEIKGPTEILTQKLKLHCNPNELTFGAKIYINGEREGTLMFYKQNGYPNNPIGFINFLWKHNDFISKAIWIWVHPAFYNDVLNEIIANFNFELTKSESHFDALNKGNQETIEDEKSELTESESDVDALNEENQEIAEDEKSVSPGLKIFLTTKIPIYNNKENCQLTILRNCLNRFRLTGPLALSIVTDAFKVPKINLNLDPMKVRATLMESDEKHSQEINLVDDTNECPMEVDLNESPKNSIDACPMEVDLNERPKDSIDAWFRTYYQPQDNLEALKIQRDVFTSLKSLNSPNLLPPNMVLALTVLDPRFFLPQKRTKSVSNSEVSEKTPVPPTLANVSPLWDSNIRSYVTRNCISAATIHSLRSQNLVPGIQNDQYFNEDIMHKIPILLIQKPGNHAHNNCIGFGSGIDIVLPAGWSMQFWIALILRCARPGGLRESKSIAYENSNLFAPVINHPDTDAYKIEADDEKAKLTEKYFKLPPNKRVNYVKYGISTPFFCEWNLLMKEWTNVDSFYVLRDYKVLSALNEKICSSSDNKRKLVSTQVQEKSLLEGLENLVQDKNCLVPIKVTSKRKGLPKDFSLICLATKADLAEYNENKTWSGPMESLKLDSNENKRKTLKKDHLAHLRKLKRQRVKAKKKMENASCNMQETNSSDGKYLEKIRQLVKKKLVDCNKTLIDQQAQVMKNLYLPKCTGVRHSCDREVIGFVTQGEFSFSEAKGVGLGYIVFSSLLNLLKENSNIVLTRNTTTRKYTICKLEILH